MDAVDYVNAAADLAAARAREDFIDHWNRLSDRCGSPLERVFLSYLMLESSGYGGQWFATDEVFETPERPIAGYVQIGIGPYFPDFYVEFHDPEFGHAWFKLAIECDGHEFHEKTKQQVARDKRRDRWLALHGISMVRFSGHEIWRAPVECAEQVFEIYNAAHRRRRAERAA